MSTFEDAIAELNTIAVTLDRAGDEAVRRGSAVVRKTALDIVATAQQLVPVDTGLTKSTIGADFDDLGIEAEIGPTTEYAPHLEYGTSRMAPHAFMGPALDRHTPDFVAALEQMADPL